MEESKTGKGRLTVKLRAARGAVPIEGALVRIGPYTDGMDTYIYSLLTNSSGETETVELPTPLGTSTLKPGITGPAYAEYNVISSKDGYYTVENIGIPIFDGITSIQTVEMIPVTEYDMFSGYAPEIRFNEGGGYGKLSSDDNTEGKE